MKRSYDVSCEGDRNALQILARGHDVTESSVTLSADVARVLYPLCQITSSGLHSRVAFWRKFTCWEDVPLPLMAFLETEFHGTNWSYVFLPSQTKTEQSCSSMQPYPGEAKLDYRSLNKILLRRPKRNPADENNLIYGLDDDVPSDDERFKSWEPNLLRCWRATIDRNSDDPRKDPDCCHYTTGTHQGRRVTDSHSLRMHEVKEKL